jgi:hypothetical protein
MSVIKNFIISVLAIIFIIILIGSFILIFILRISCANAVAEEVFSPDKKYKIVVFERNCGATNDFSTQISILDSDEDLGNENGNLFVGDSDHGRAILSDKNVIHTNINWQNNKTILIEVDSSARIFVNKTYYRGFKILYK